MTVSRAKLRDLEPVADLPPPEALKTITPLRLDERSAELANQVVVDAELVDTIETIFAGSGFVKDRDKVRMLVNVRAEINSKWKDTRDAYLAIGRSLLALDTKFSREESEMLRANMDQVFPFSDSVGSQLRACARAVDSGRLPFESCPSSYATAYQIAMLSDAQLEIAKQKGLIRINVTRSEIVSFRKELKSGSAPVNEGETKAKRALLLRKQKRLEFNLKQVLDEIARLDAE